MSNQNKPPYGVSRRKFIGTAAAAAGITIVPRHVLGAGFQAPSDTVNVAVVGYRHGMGTSNLLNVARSDNIVALCDCDDSAAALAFAIASASARLISAAVRSSSFAKAPPTRRQPSCSRAQSLPCRSESGFSRSALGSHLPIN